MTELHLPFIQLTVAAVLGGAIWVSRQRDPEFARQQCLIVNGIAMLFALAAWLDYVWIGSESTVDRWDLGAAFLGREFFSLDGLSAPLLPLAALLYLLAVLATPRTKAGRFSYGWTLGSEAVLLATFACRAPWGIIALLALSAIHPIVELRARGRATQVFIGHMALGLGAFAAGWFLLERTGSEGQRAFWPVALILVGVLVRSGIVPFHCWIVDLFEHATFGTALLFVTPMMGAYAAVRLLLPIAPPWALQVIVLMSLLTAIYGAGMALIQREARRYFSYLFLSHSALILVGLDVATPISLTGALSVWLSMGLSLAAFGLTIRAIEARTGRLSLTDYHGLYEHTPTLATFFLLTGLASVGFPGTFGFVGMELLVDGTVQAYPYIGSAVVIAAALNGIAIVQVYFLIFTGRRHVASVSLRRRRPEQIAVLTLAALIILGGLFPQPIIASRHRAAATLVQARQVAVSQTREVAAAQ